MPGALPNWSGNSRNASANARTKSAGYELALKENQLRTEQLQKKLDALLAIDRELRSRGKDR